MKDQVSFTIKPRKVKDSFGDAGWVAKICTVGYESVDFEFNDNVTVNPKNNEGLQKPVGVTMTLAEAEEFAKKLRKQVKQQRKRLEAAHI